MRFFEELGASISEQWERADYDAPAFPVIAATALREGEPCRHVAARDVIEWLLSTRELPPQDDIDAKFGEPPVTVFHGRRFYIKVVFWLEGTTTIHRHAFSGAFAVLEGSSLHSEYTFRRERTVSAHFALGRLELASATMLSPGDVVPVAGNLLHSLFHLDRPSATVLVRTYSDPGASPQFDYAPPGVAVDPFFRDPVTIRRVQGLAHLRQLGDATYLDAARDAIARSDLHAGYLVLEDATRALGRLDGLVPLLPTFRTRHGTEVATTVARSLEEQLRQTWIVRMRTEVRDPELRFFLALLLNLPDREAILALVARRFPQDEPRARVARWLDGLSGAELLGVDLEDDTTSALVRALMDGCDGERLFERLGEEFDAGDVAAQREDIDEHCARLRRSALSPLFVSSARGSSSA